MEKVPESQDDTDAKLLSLKKLLDKLSRRSDSDPKKSPVATAPVELDSERYNMNHPNRGKAVIFNHEEFSIDQPNRPGTRRDEIMLQMCLETLGFEVIVHRDLRKSQILQTLYQLKIEDHSNNDCLLIVVLSHGDENKIYSNDSYYKPEDLWKYFTADECSTLAGKPKLFFIQACRGDQVDSGTQLSSRTETDTVAQKPKGYVVPNLADFLIVYATTPGHVSFRSQVEGSWFIQSLTSVLATYSSDKDLLSMMTIVARTVAVEFQSNVPQAPGFHQKKQVPMISSTLIREVHLKPKNNKNDQVE